MIYTLTFNPSIDYLIELETEVAVGKMNRSKNTQYLIGGKGINVSQVLKNLKTDSVALGFVGGFVGNQIVGGLENIGVACDFIEVEGINSRINVKLHTSVDTEINAKGPDIDEEALSKMCRRVAKLKEEDLLIVSGSVAANMTLSDWEKILDSMSAGRFICDMAGDFLLDSLKYNPFLVKPNHIELAQALGRKILPDDGEAVKRAAGELIERGAQNVLVSCAEYGAYLVGQGGDVIYCRAPKGEAVNTVGAGDSMLAGFVAGYESSGGDRNLALRLGVAAGSATAFRRGLASGDEIERIMKN